MPIHTVLAVLVGDPSDRAVLETAFLVAAPQGEITALHVKVDRQAIVPLMGEGASGTMVAEIMESLEREAAARASRARAEFERWCVDHEVAIREDVAGAPSGTEAIWREIAGQEYQVAPLFGRNTDLIVLPRRESVADTGTIESCLFTSGRPVLLAPPAVPQSLGRKIGIFWNASSQAARAVGEARPLLRKADRVTIYTTGIEAPAPSAGDLARRLSRMRITTMVDMVSPSGKEPSEFLLSAAERNEDDLIVMGGYGHSRFRELILGGVTRAMLQKAKVAAFLSH